MGSKQATATIRTACPLHHHQNVDDCCSKGGQWCTCVLEQNIDLNFQPYKELGNRNGYGTVAMGACGSSLEALNISVTSERANRLIQPFLKSGEVCRGEALAKSGAQPPAIESQCTFISDRTSCGHAAGCSWCEAVDAGPVKSGCFNFGEAEMLTHIFTAEKAASTFRCGLQLTAAIAANGGASEVAPTA
jgi:hypothetical protein